MFFISDSKRESTRKAIGSKGAEETQYSKVKLNFGQMFSFIKLITQMSLCDSLQIIGHSGLRTKTKERKRSRYKNLKLKFLNLKGTLARTNCFTTCTRPHTLPRFVENNAGERHQFHIFGLNMQRASWLATEL